MSIRRFFVEKKPLVEWVDVTGKHLNIGSSLASQQSSASSTTSNSAYIVTIVYDNRVHKLRAVADDGVHGKANVAFPNDLRKREGQKYSVDELIWNGKNYRVSGEIVEI